jgi:hypothetical protein
VVPDRGPVVIIGGRFRFSSAGPQQSFKVSLWKRTFDFGYESGETVSPSGM